MNYSKPLQSMIQHSTLLQFRQSIASAAKHLINGNWENDKSANESIDTTGEEKARDTTAGGFFVIINLRRSRSKAHLTWKLTNRN
jgi:hypothetical protein